MKMIIDKTFNKLPEEQDRMEKEEDLEQILEEHPFS